MTSAVMRGLSPCCLLRVWLSACTHPKSALLTPLLLGGFVAKVLKLVLYNAVAYKAVLEEIPLRPAPEAALAMFLAVVVAWLMSIRLRPSSSQPPEPSSCRQPVYPLASRASAMAAPFLRWASSLPCLAFGLPANSNVEGADALPATPLRSAWRAAWWAEAWCRPAGLYKALRCGRGRDAPAVTSAPTQHRGHHLRLDEHQNHSGPVRVAAPVESGVSARNPYVRRSGLSSTLVKIRGHGAHPELIARGYQQRIAAVVAAAGQQLKGVYVRRGCIELVVDACRLAASSHPPVAAAAPELSLAEACHTVGHLDVDQLIRALQLPPDEATGRRHTAVVWQLPGPGGSGGNDEPNLTSVDAVMAAEADAAADSPTLTVRPCVVCSTAPSVVTPLPEPAAFAEASSHVDAAAVSSSVSIPSAAASAAVASAADVTAAAAAAATAATTESTGARASPLTVQVWLPPRRDTGEAPPEAPTLSARCRSTLLSVATHWDVVTVGTRPTRLTAGQPADGGLDCAAPSSSPTAKAPPRAQDPGRLFTGTCCIDGLPRGAALVLLQARVSGGPERRCFTRPVPVLCVDDLRVAAEVGRLAADCVALEQLVEMEDFVVDLGVFLSGVARGAAAYAAACSTHELAQLQELGCHLHDWLAGDVEEMWPATLDCLRSGIDAIAGWLEDSPAEGRSTAGLEGDKTEGAELPGRSNSSDSSGNDGGHGRNAQSSSRRGGVRKVSSFGSARGGAGNGGTGGGSGAGGMAPGGCPPMDVVATAATPAGSRSGGASLSLSLLGFPQAAGAGRRGLTSSYACGVGRVCREWSRRSAAVRAFLCGMYCGLSDPAYQDFLTRYCAMQAPVLDVMFFMSVGSIVVRTWQEEPQWRQRPLPCFLAYLSPCLITSAASVLSTAARPLLPHPTWTCLVRTCMLLRYLCFCVGLMLIGAGWTPPPPAIAVYHQRGAAVMLGEGVLLSATVVVMPASALLLALLRVPAHVAVWMRVGAYDDLADAVPFALLLAGCSMATNLLLHAVLLVQYRRRAGVQGRLRSKTD